LRNKKYHYFVTDYKYKNNDNDNNTNNFQNIFISYEEIINNLSKDKNALTIVS